MTEVHLRRITAAIEEACLGLRVGDDQVGFVGTNTQSLDQAKANPGLVPLAIYDRAACGYPQPRVPMIGFVMYEIDCGVGFILRLMIVSTRASPQELRRRARGSERHAGSACGSSAVPRFVSAA
jgi:hypothetical protein